MDTHQPFKGDKKEGMSLLGPPEKRFILWLAPRIPSWIQSYHLTLSTLIWSAGVILFSSLAAKDLQWLWGTSLMIALQWASDSVDGTLGKMRHTNLARWGFYMDHFLDYLFLCALLIGYDIMAQPEDRQLMFFILAVCGGFMVHSYLAFAATGHFRIAFFGIGPTELRLVFIIINTLLIAFGKTYLAAALPYTLLLCAVGLFVVVCKTQLEIWESERSNKL